jgi:hypothetical protein
MNDMNLEKYLGVLAGLVIGSAQLIYLLNGLKRKVTPSVLSWFGWACLMGTSLVAQVIGKGWQWSMTGILCSTVGCIVIAGVAFFSGNYSFRKVDLSFLVVGLICVAIYLLSSDPWITTIFAIIADAVLGIPTIRNAVRAPKMERSAAWGLGVVSSTLALIICMHHDWIYVLFPGYLFLFNGTMAVLTWGNRETGGKLGGNGGTGGKLRGGKGEAGVKALFLVGLLAGVGMIGSGCKKHSQPATAVRSYRMGFMSSAPRPDLTLILKSLSLWPGHSDATIISTEVPWDSLLNGQSAVTYVKNNYIQLVSICRQQNLKLWVYIDPENGLNRSSDSDPLVALGKSIAQRDVQQVYRRFVVAMDSVLQPDHLGLALETNLIRFIAPDSIYQGVKAAVNGAAGDIRAFDSKVPLSVSVQAEVAWGRLGGSTYLGVNQDFSDFPFLEELGISSYPYLGGFASPAAIPLNYYSQLAAGHELAAGHALPVFVAEGGWSSTSLRNPANGQIIASNLAQQAAYIDRQGQLLAGVNGIGLFQLTYTDLDLAAWPATDSAGLYPFAYLGVVDSNFAAKPALAAWDSLRQVPLEQGH